MAGTEFQIQSLRAGGCTGGAVAAGVRGPVCRHRCAPSAVPARSEGPGVAPPPRTTRHASCRPRRTRGDNVGHRLGPLSVALLLQLAHVQHGALLHDLAFLGAAQLQARHMGRMSHVRSGAAAWAAAKQQAAGGSARPAGPPGAVLQLAGRCSASAGLRPRPRHAARPQAAATPRCPTLSICIRPEGCDFCASRSSPDLPTLSLPAAAAAGSLPLLMNCWSVMVGPGCLCPRVAADRQGARTLVHARDSNCCWDGPRKAAAPSRLVTSRRRRQRQGSAPAARADGCAAANTLFARVQSELCGGSPTDSRSSRVGLGLRHGSRAAACAQPVGLRRGLQCWGRGNSTSGPAARQMQACGGQVSRRRRGRFGVTCICLGR